MRNSDVHPTLDSRQIWFWLLAAIVSGGLAGCASGPQTCDVSFKLTLYRTTTDRRFTYFELAKNGELAFGGGQNAVRRVAEPVITLSAQQLQKVRQVLIQHRIFDTPKPSLAKPSNVSYELDVSSADRRRRIRCVDEQIPAIRTLHQLLFQIQADQRYRPDAIRQ